MLVQHASTYMAQWRTQPENPVIFQGGDDRFPILAEAESILPLYITGMQINLNCIPDDEIHLRVFGAEDAGVMELHVVS